MGTYVNQISPSIYSAGTASDTIIAQGEELANNLEDITQRAEAALTTLSELSDKPPLPNYQNDVGDAPAEPNFDALDTILAAVKAALGVDTPPTVGDLDSAATFAQYDPGLTAVITDTDFPTAPNLDLVLALPSPPTFGTYNLPAAPGINADLTMPASPDVALPSVPTLAELIFPDIPQVAIPEIDFSFDIPSLVPPSAEINYTHQAYQSDLLDSTRAWLQDQVDNGGTGLAPAVEQNIWDRARDRTSITLMNATDQVLAGTAARGFSLPQGHTIAALNTAFREAQTEYANTSREIAIKQAELAQTNTHYAVTEARSLETVLIDAHDKYLNRLLEVAVTAAKLRLEVFNAQIAKYNADVSAYRLIKEGYQLQIEAELAKVELYGKYLEGVKIQGQLQQVQVEIYKTQVESVQVAYQAYKTQVEAVVAQIEKDKVAVEIYKATIEGVNAAVRAELTKVEAYKAQIQGETAKAQLLESSAKMYASQVEATKAIVETKQIQANVAIATADSKTKGYQAGVAKYEADIGKMKVEKDLELAAFGNNVEMYKTRVQELLGRMDAEVKKYLGVYETDKQKWALNIEQFKANVGLYEASIREDASNKQAASSIWGALLSAVAHGLSVNYSLGARSDANLQFSHAEHLSNQLQESYSF